MLHSNSVVEVKMRKPERRRHAPSSRSRAMIFEKTAGHCHVCGTNLKNEKWQADHVVLHNLGGSSNSDNYLPICRICNRLRWSYSPEMISCIFRVGIFAKQEIRHRTNLGIQIIEIVWKHMKSVKKRKTQNPLDIHDVESMLRVFAKKKRRNPGVTKRNK